MATFTSYSFNLSADDAWRVACLLSDAANQAKKNGSLATGNHLYDLAVKFSCVSFEADVLGYDKSDEIEMTFRSKGK